MIPKYFFVVQLVMILQFLTISLLIRVEKAEEPKNEITQAIIVFIGSKTQANLSLW